MSDGVRKKGDRADNPRQDSDANGDPLYSHIRELAPREGAEVSGESRKEPGFFAQAARISMGTAFPALRSVARFLTLESYRTLPKHDRLPNLDDVIEADVTKAGVIEADVIEADLDDLLESPEEELPKPAEQLLDWDELEIDELAPTPYRLYLFDVRIEGYLRQTKAQLSPLLLIEG